MNRALGILMAAGLVLACATEPTPARWATADGGEPDADVLAAAEERCAQQVEQRLPSARRAANLEWAVAMVECLEAEGFFRVRMDSE